MFFPIFFSTHTYVIFDAHGQIFLSVPMLIACWAIKESNIKVLYLDAVACLSLPVGNLLQHSLLLTMFFVMKFFQVRKYMQILDSGEIRTRASEETGA